MRITTKALVISKLKYAESSLIVRVFTQSDGMKSYLLRGVLGSKKGKLKAAYFLPLSQIEISAIHKNKNSLEQLIEVKVLHPYKTAHTHIVKNSLVLFISEVLGQCIREEEQNDALFQFLSNAFLWLDSNEKTANFHLSFLMQLSAFLGCYPDDRNKDLSYFDIEEGAFSSQKSGRFLIEAEEIVAFRQLLGTNFDESSEVAMLKKTRKQLLTSILRYYQLHINGFKEPKSLAVLHEIFIS